MAFLIIELFFINFIHAEDEVIDSETTALLAPFHTTYSDQDTGSLIVINNLSFDSSIGQIRISYCIDSTLIPSNSDLEVVIAYSIDRYPQRTTGFPVNTVLSFCTDTIVPLVKPLWFDTLYYVSLWLRQPGGVWVEPAENSRDTVRIGNPYKQTIHLFDPDKSEDTIPVFNGSVLLWKDQFFNERNVYPYLLQVHHTFLPIKGLRSVSPTISFVDAEPTLPFYIGFAINSLPAGRTMRDVRIYTKNGANASVIYETVVDSAHGIVYFKTDDLKPTFVAMVDTSAPSAKILDSDIHSPISSVATLQDTVTISDNISNARYRFYFGKGNEVPPLRESGTLSDTSATITLSVSDTSHAISSEYGLRAWLVVTDGAHEDTIDLSRAVKRAESDPITTMGGTWNPVYATARLLHKDMDSLIARLSGNDTTGYDSRQMRLYRWVSYEGNRDSSSKWVEYTKENETIKKLFTLDPGTMVWLKTRENKPLHLDSANTLSPGDTFSVTLPAKEWTDFGMPFRFGVPLSEILAATGSDAENIDVCQWIADDSSHQFSLEPLFIHGRANQLQNILLEYNSHGGYSFFNQSDKPVTLRIPSTLPAMAAAKIKVLSKRYFSGNAWGVSFSAVTERGEKLPPLYCGYASGMTMRTVPAGPSFQSIQMMFAERGSKRLCACSIGEENAKGFTREILLHNGGDSTQNITWNLEEEGPVPENYYTTVYDPATGLVSQSGSISVDKRSTVSRFIITGDAAYHERFNTTMSPVQYLLHAPYPNPARSAVTIRYTVPAGAQERVNISIYSVAGRLVWTKGAGGFLKSGVNTIIWSGCNQDGSMTASGVYVIRLDVVQQNGSRMKQFERRITLLH